MAVQEYNTGGTYNWTCPTGVTSVDVDVYGAGGGGGGGSIAEESNAGGGGGAGGRSILTGYAVTAGTVYTVVVGSGGAQGSDGTNGLGGSDSYFSATNICLGGGGSGGGGGDYFGAGGNGGSGTTSTGASGGSAVGTSYGIGGAGTRGSGGRGGLSGSNNNGVAGESGYVSLTYTITSNSFTIISGSPLPSGTTGEAYSQYIEAQSGTQPYGGKEVSTISAGTLPVGIYYSSITGDGDRVGLLSGTTNTAGTYTFTVRAVDDDSTEATKQFTLTIEQGVMLGQTYIIYQ